MPDKPRRDELSSSNWLVSAKQTTYSKMASTNMA